MNIRRYLIAALLISVTLLLISPEAEYSQTGKANPSFKRKSISSLTFIGNTKITDRELLDIFEFEDDIAGNVNRLFTRQFDQNEIDSLVKYRIREFLATRGYIGGTVGEVTYIVRGETVRIVVPIVEGKLHRFGDMKIKGSDALATQQIIDILGFKTGDIFNREAFQRAVFSDIPKLYGSKGYAECSVDQENVTLRPNPEESDEIMVDFDLVIDEGQRFRIETVNFVGDAEPDKLHSFLTFKTGDIFDRSKIDESIKQINGSGEYEQVSFDQHVEIRNTYIGRNYRDTIGSSLPKVDAFLGKTTISIIVKKLKPARAYNIGSVKFVGNKIISDNELKKVLGLDHSGYFDVLLFIEKVREFNKAGRTKPITEGDLDLELGEKGRDDDEFADQIHITIRIRELPKISSRTR